MPKSYKFSNVVVGQELLKKYLQGDTKELPPSFFEGNSEIKDRKFYHTKIEKIILPKSVKTIGKEVFYFSNLKSINLENIETIETERIRMV